MPEIEDLSVEDAWSRLAADPRALLIDVRTQAEWAFVGLPDLATIGKSPILMEWQNFPDNRIDPDFAAKLAAELRRRETTTDDELFFICRSGGRSMMAAKTMAQLGFGRCRNVAGGFEGPLDGHRHRGTAGGWKAAGLPWAQG